MLTQDITDNFYKALDEMEKPDGAFLTANLESPDFMIEAEYSRQNFIADIEQSVASLDEEQKTDTTSFFGFVIDRTGDVCTIKGYPSVTNIQRENRFPASKIYYCVSLFTEENKVFVKDNPVLSKCLNAIIAAFPEFLTMVGKLQHHTHDYTVDVHTLKVLQGVIAHPQFKALPEEDKKALEIAVLLHDITKKEGEIDKSHPACSARDTSFILNKTYLSDEQKEKICLIIKNHDWLERYNRGITSPEQIAEEFKDGNNFIMACLLSEADLKGVQRGGTFYRKHCDALNKGYQEISGLIKSKCL